MTTSVPSDESPRAFGLSKSRLAAFEQCPKRLWLAVHRPDVAVVDAGAMIRFGVGHEAGWTCSDKVESFPEMKGELDDQAEGVYAGV